MTSRLKDTLLLVGSGGSDREELREIFESGYNLLEAETAKQAEFLLKQNIHCIAAVLADIPISFDQDIRALAQACQPGTEQEVPFIVFIHPSGTGEVEELAFAMGATDVVHKPYTASTVQRRVQVLVDLYLHKWHLETLVEEQSKTIRNTNQVMLDALSAIIEHRDTESGNHVLRIRRFTKILLEEAARCCPEYCLTRSDIDSIASASALHDIGKISIPDAILNKPGRLSPEEFEVIKTHTTVGGELVTHLTGIGDEDFLRYAYNIALYHHERWDGKGYPRGLKGDEIPICAQVVGIADAYDALTTQRPYKAPFPHSRAFNMIVNGECGRFSPKLLECFKHVQGQFETLATQYADGYSPKSDHITVPLPGPVHGRPKLDSLQLSQLKYQTLMHHTGGAVVEFDLDNKTFHLVYNPHPEFQIQTVTNPFDLDSNSLFIAGVHPEDLDTVRQTQKFLTHDLFERDIWKKSFHFRLYSSTTGKFLPYQVTLLRVNTQDQSQRIALAVFQKMEQAPAEPDTALPENVYTSPALYGLVSSALRCRADEAMTIDAGAQDLYQLTGFTRREIQDRFRSSYLALILPADREKFHRSMEPCASGAVSESEHRLLCADGSSVWVLSKSRMVVESDGKAYFYHAIRDNSHAKALQMQMLTDAERNRLVIDQSGLLTFEWDLINDAMSYSHKWAGHFGYIPPTENYRAQLGTATHFHPDDLAVVRENIALLQSGRDQAYMEVRIANSQGRYLWSKITATGFRDESGALTRVIGTLQDIDELKRAAISLKDQAERDTLTKLLNKVSTQNLATQYLSERDPDRMAALLILDLDNFKSVNDTLGHLYGDAVLAQVGASLKKLFRAHDIIGRIGGDEFVILLKDIPDQELLVKRCNTLLETFRNLMQSMMPDLNVSCSIGAALAPIHGTGYNELFQRADEALYLAKGRGKNNYVIYNPRNKLENLLEVSARVPTRIDSDHQPGMADDSFVRQVFRTLYESSCIEDTVQELLESIGKHFNVSRVYIFENNDDNTACSNTFEWCNTGIQPEKDNLQNLRYQEDLTGLENMYDERGVFYCTDITQLESNLRQVLEPQGIKSMLHCSIVEGGVFRGYVGFDECTVNRMWTQDQISMLKFLSEVLAMFLLKKRTQDKVTAQAENLRSILDQQDAWIYVIEPDSGELKFLNKKIKQLIPDSRPGMTCCKVFMGRDERCADCPAANIHRDKNRSATLDNPHLGIRIQVNASEISWNDKNACLITCRELREEA